MRDPRSVSRVIEDLGADSLRIRDRRRAVAMHTGAGIVARAFGPLPRRPYRVTYRLDPDGDLTVTGRAVRTVSWARKAVCFLPEAWDGRRVTREVEELESPGSLQGSAQGGTI